MLARRSSGRLVAVPLFALLLGGCAEEEVLSGHIWEITAKGVEVTDATACVEGQLDVTDSFEYRVNYDGNDFDIAIGSDSFASGSVSGCYFSYKSIQWTEDRNGYRITWRILGEGQVRHGGRNCNQDSDWDWDVLERFEVIKSEDPTISPGCQYHMKLEGMYKGRVQ